VILSEYWSQILRVLVLHKSHVSLEFAAFVAMVMISTFEVVAMIPAFVAVVMIPVFVAVEMISAF